MIYTSLIYFTYKIYPLVVKYYVLVVFWTFNNLEIYLTYRPTDLTLLNFFPLDCLHVGAITLQKMRGFVE